METHCAAASDYKPTLKCSGVLVDAVQIWSNGGHVTVSAALRSAPLTPQSQPITYTSPSLCLLHTPLHPFLSPPHTLPPTPFFSPSPTPKGMFISTPHLLCRFLHPSPLCGFFSPPLSLSPSLSHAVRNGSSHRDLRLP